MNRIFQVWNRYWFQSAPYINLAVLRILSVALAILTTTILRHKIQRAFLLITLPEDLYQPPVFLRLLTFQLGHPAIPSEGLISLFTWILVIFGIFALVGMKTNISLLALSMGYMFLNALNYSFGEFHHPESILMISLLILTLSPCGKVLSLDHLIQQRRTRSITDKPAPDQSWLKMSSIYAYWPTKLIQWIFALIYLSAAVAKIFKGGLDWVNGYTLQFYLLDSGVRRTTPLGIWLGQQHSLSVLFSAITLFFEGTFWLVPLFPKLAWIYLPIGAGMHIAIYLTMRPDFYEFVVLYAVFISWAGVFLFVLDKTRRLNRIPLLGYKKTRTVDH